MHRVAIWTSPCNVYVSLARDSVKEKTRDWFTYGGPTAKARLRLGLIGGRLGRGNVIPDSVSGLVNRVMIRYKIVNTVHVTAYDEIKKQSLFYSMNI